MYMMFLAFSLLLNLSWYWESCECAKDNWKKSRSSREPELIENTETQAGWTWGQSLSQSKIISDMFLQNYQLFCLQKFNFKKIETVSNNLWMSFQNLESRDFRAVDVADGFEEVVTLVDDEDVALQFYARRFPRGFVEDRIVRQDDKLRTDQNKLIN